MTKEILIRDILGMAMSLKEWRFAGEVYCDFMPYRNSPDIGKLMFFGKKEYISIDVLYGPLHVELVGLLLKRERNEVIAAYIHPFSLSEKISYVHLYRMTKKSLIRMRNAIRRECRTFDTNIPKNYDLFHTKCVRQFPIYI